MRDDKPSARGESSDHHPNPPGNPLLRQNQAETEKARQKELAHEEHGKASQTDHISQHTLPIKQPNKATNNS